MATDIATLGLEVDARPIDRAPTSLDRFARGAEETERRTGRLTRATDLAAAAFSKLAQVYAAYQVGQQIKDSAMLAARYETMAVVMRVAGNNAGYTNLQMQQFQKTLMATGISMIQSRQALTSLATANIDLAKATELARAAQNLAVVGNMNSSAALESMIKGIKSAETEVLQTIGLNIKFEAGYEKMAKTLGKSTSALTEHEKMMARTNQVLKEATAYNGIYEASMTTAGKQISSLSRYLEDMKTKAGEVFLPVLSRQVEDLTNALKMANAELERQGGKQGTLMQMGEAAAFVWEKVSKGAVSAAETVAAKAVSIHAYFKGIITGAQALLRGDGIAGWQEAMRAASEAMQDASNRSGAFRDGLYQNERALKAAAKAAKDSGLTEAQRQENEAKAAMRSSTLAATREYELEQQRIAEAEAARAAEAAAQKRQAAEEAAKKAGDAALEKYRDLIASIKEKIRAEELAVSANREMTSAEEFAAEVRSQLADGTMKQTASQKANTNAMLDSLLVVEQQRLAMERRREALEDQAEADARSVQDLEERNKSLREEIANYGLSTKAINDNTIARLEWEIANKELSDSQIAARQAKIALLQEQSSLQQDLDNAKLATERADDEKRAYEDQMKVRLAETVKAQEGIDQIFREGFSAMLQGGSDSWKSWTRSLKNTFKTAVADELYKMFAKPFVVQVVGQFAGMFGGSAGGSALASAGSALGGPAGSAMNLLSTAKNLYSSFTGGGMGSLAAYAGKGLSYLGNAMGSNSVYSFGQGLQGFSAGGVGSGIAPGASSFGASAAPYVNMLGGVAAGVYGGRAISNGYSVSGSGNGMVNAGTLIGAVVGGPIGAAIGGAIAGGINRLFGHRPKEVTTRGIEGDFGASGVNGRSFEQWKQEGGVFRSDKRGTDYSAFPDELSKQMHEGFMALSKATEGYMHHLGVTGENLLANYRKTFSIVLTEDAAANQKAIEDLFAGTADQMAETLVPNIKDFAKAGESAGMTLQRLAEQFAATNQVAMALGSSAEQLFGGRGVSSAAVRERLIEMSGGIEALAASANAFASNFLTEAEKLAPVQKALAESLAALGYASVDTREEFKSAVQGLISSGAAMTEQGAKDLAGLLALSEAFAMVYPEVESATNAIDKMADVLSQRKDLERQLNELVMTSTQLREEERKEIDASNLAIFDAITAARALAEAQEIYADGLDSALQAAQDQARAALEGVRQAVEAQKELLREQYRADVEAAQARQKIAEEAKDKEISTARERAQAMKTLYDRIKGTSKELNALSAEQAQGVLESALAAARGGQRLDSIPGLEDALQAATSRTTDAYSTREEFLRAQYATGRVLEELTDHAGGQLSVSELQLRAAEASLEQLKRMHQEELKALESKYEADVAAAERMYTFAQDQLNALNGIYTSATSIEQAMQFMQAALTNLAKAQDAQPPKATTPATSGAVTDSALEHLYKELLGRSADAAGLDFWKNALKSGSTLGDVAKAIQQSAEYKTLKGYSAGGMKPAGMAVVGELGPEVVTTGPARVWSNDQMRDAFGGREVPALLQKLLAEVAELRREQRTGDQAVVIAVKDQTKLLRDVTDEGTALLTKAAE